MTRKKEELLFPSGGYEKLKTFQLGQLLYDLTVLFCERYVPANSRTRDQMVQAARSGIQNIVTTFPGTPLQYPAPNMRRVSAERRHSVSIRDNPELAANAALSLLNLNLWLPKRQIDSKAERLQQQGGFNKRLYRQCTKIRNLKT